jgi:hypothetical protein
MGSESRHLYPSASIWGARAPPCDGSLATTGSACLRPSRIASGRRPLIGRSSPKRPTGGAWRSASGRPAVGVDLRAASERAGESIGL